MLRLHLPASVHSAWHEIVAFAKHAQTPCEPKLDVDARSKLEQLAQQSEEAATLAVRELSSRLRNRNLTPVRSSESGQWELHEEDPNVWAPNVTISGFQSLLGAS